MVGPGPIMGDPVGGGSSHSSSRPHLPLLPPAVISTNHQPIGVEHTLGQPARPRAQEVPPGCPRISLAHTLPLAMAADAPGCEAMTPVLSTTCACDTVNLPEFPIMYLFWVLTLCTETAAHGCFFTKNKNKKQWEKKTLHSMHFLVLCYACMCLAERTRFIGFGDL